ncbi:hypothetical protein CPC08DRAFT_613987, partial [Agrocybe pediades]
AVQKNSTGANFDPSRTVPSAPLVVINIAERPARALIDTGSLCDFISSSLADQLELKRTELVTPLVVQLAVQGSRSRVNYRVTTTFAYQGINENRDFDVINLSNYDVILGTPFLYQYSAAVGLNPTRVIIGSTTSLPIEGHEVKTLQSRAAQLEDNYFE